MQYNGLGRCDKLAENRPECLLSGSGQTVFTKSRKGFTLVELMIVIAVIGILASIAMPNLLKANRKAKTQACKANLATLNRTVELYNVDHNGYPNCADMAALNQVLGSYFAGKIFPECPNKIPYLVIQDIPGDSGPGAVVEVICPEHGMYNDTSTGGSSGSGN